MATGFVQRFKGKFAMPWLGMYQAGAPAVAVFYVTGAPTSGTSGTYAKLAPPGALLVTSEPAFYQNTNTLASPTWTAAPLSGAAGITSGTIDGATIGASSPSTGAFTFVDTSYATGLTSIGTNRGTSLALTKQINNITTTTSSATGVTLPAVSAVGVGGFVRVINNGSSSMHVYGAGSDTIDGAAAATGVVLTNAFYADYWASAAATYISTRVAFVVSA